MKLKAKFWDYNEKNMGFHLTTKKYYFWLHPGDENVIGIRAFNFKNQDRNLTLNCIRYSDLPLVHREGVPWNPP